MEILLLIAIMGALTGFLSGLLGIGGGIVMAPLLLYTPVIFNLPSLGMHTVAGLTIVQGLAACIAGGMAHKRSGYYSKELVLWMGSVFFIASFTGGVISRFVSAEMLLFVFAVLAFSASVIMFFRLEREEPLPDIAQFSFSRPRAVLVAAAIGLLGGLVGQGGSFILIPLMITLMQIPTRIAIGSNLAIVFLATFAAFLGKALTSQIEWMLTIPIILTVIPFSYLGARVSNRVQVDNLKIIFAVCIAFAAFRIGFSALGF